MANQRRAIGLITILCVLTSAALLLPACDLVDRASGVDREPPEPPASGAIVLPQSGPAAEAPSRAGASYWPGRCSGERTAMRL